MHNDVYGAWHRYGRTQIDTRLGGGGCGDGSEASWAGVFWDLATRGLKRVLISVADGFPGVEETDEKLYPLPTAGSASCTCRGTSGWTFRRSCAHK